MNFGFSSRTQTRIPDIAKISHSFAYRKSPRRVNNSAPIPILNPKEMTQKQYVESLEASLTSQLAECNSNHKRYQVFQNVFQSIVDRYGSNPGVLAVKRGYDEVISNLQHYIQERNHKNLTRSTSQEQFNTEISRQREKLAEKRKKNADLDKKLDFVLSEIKREIEDKTDEIVSVQQKAMKANNDVRDKTINISDLKHFEDLKASEYEKALKTKNNFEEQISQMKDNHENLKNQLSELMNIVFEESKTERDTKSQLDESRSNLNNDIKELEDIKHQLTEMQENYTKDSAILQQKNEEFDKNCARLNELKKALTKIQSMFE